MGAVSLKDLTAINDIDSRLAMELAFEISDLPVILSRHGLTKSELQTKLNNPAFRNMVREAKAAWNSDLSVKERIRLKSMVLVEDSLLELYGIFHNRELAPTARLEAFKNMAKVATVDAPDKDNADVGSRVQINISIPGVAPAVKEGVVYQHEEAE
jgi:hypothetical protein